VLSSEYSTGIWAESSATSGWCNCSDAELGCDFADGNHLGQLLMVALVLIGQGE